MMMLLKLNIEMFSNHNLILQISQHHPELSAYKKCFPLWSFFQPSTHHEVFKKRLEEKFALIFFAVLKCRGNKMKIFQKATLCITIWKFTPEKKISNIFRLVFTPMLPQRRGRQKPFFSATPFFIPNKN